jgi:predicted O-methyltransferase YrrM
MRNFRRELQDDRCWDRTTQALFEAHGEPLRDCILQNREELIALCEFIEAQQIRSYLEIGIWTGRLISTLHRLFSFERVAACDHGWAEQLGLSISLPKEVVLFRGDSGTDAFRRWRADLAAIDLVLIDADHRYQAVAEDFATNRAFPHRFIALHDITGATRQTRGVGRFWRELVEGDKLEIVRPHRELGLDHSTMGIGIWCAQRATRPTPASR